MKILVWGANAESLGYANLLTENYEIVGYVDPAEHLHEIRIDGKHKVIGPKELKKTEYDAIVIGNPSKHEEIILQWNLQTVNKKIFSVNDLLEIRDAKLPDEALSKRLKVTDSIIRGTVLAQAPLLLRNVTIKGCGFIGAYTYALNQVTIKNVTSIGRFCTIAENVILWNANHSLEALSTHPMFLPRYLPWLDSFYEDMDEEKYLGWCKEIKKKHRLSDSKKKTLIIGNDVWIGNGAKILQGVTVGDGAVIGAGAVVTKDVEPYSIVGGNPAKLIRYRFSKDIIKRLSDIQWWKYGPHILVGLDIIEPTHRVLDILEERILRGKYSKREGTLYRL